MIVTTNTFIKQRRKELNLTLKDIATKMNVSESTISRYESGQIQNMSADKLYELANILHCAPNELLGLNSTEDYILPRENDCNSSKHFKDITSAKEYLKDIFVAAFDGNDNLSDFDLISIANTIYNAHKNKQ